MKWNDAGSRQVEKLRHNQIMAKKIIERIPCVCPEGLDYEVLVYQRIGYRRDELGNMTQHFGHKSIALKDNSAVERLPDNTFRVVWSGKRLRRAQQRNST